MSLTVDIPPRPTLYDRLSAGCAARPALRVAVPGAITLVAGILRFWNLGHPHELVFDETYYVKDAWSQWNLGYAAKWPDAADTRFAAGETDIFLDLGSYVVHPPLGKYLIGAGMALFGADSSFGWRFATALFGTAAVLLLYLVALTLTRSIGVAVAASGLMAIDGLAIVLSRVALLDVFVMFFTLLTFWFVLLDRGWMRRRWPWPAASDDDPPHWGRVFWWRPWILAAGCAAGCATAVKWSGLYVLAGVGIYLVVMDVLERRRRGILNWPTDAILRQGPATFVALVPVAFVVYLASWTGWLVTDGGYDRDSADSSPATGFWSWVPLSIQSLWRYHQSMYGFHVGLSAEHGYASPAWQWPLLVRPTSMFYHSLDQADAACGVAGGCVQNIYSMPNPLIWYASVAATVYLVVRFVRRRDWQSGFVLTGIAVTWVPWLLYPERTVFQFYTVVILPFLLLALALAMRDIARPRPDAPEKRVAAQRVLWVLVIAAIALSAFWYPILTATTVPYDFWRLHNWSPTWI
ncbi:dolichyl-phosphate-mannose--protein mannosyltransferase [Microbacterium sediminicola]|uniref:dolichyl-phosphate-mannose--protein mannosyltransferase n=1 Tax=Microbacterium sediminicola TaxID=415210 RepID=UPI0031D615BD